jgi:LysM repeat protein
LAGCQTASSPFAHKRLPGTSSSRSALAARLKAPEPVFSTQAQSRVNSIMKTAFSQVGNPYRYGGNSPETGFDCSGFVGWVYKQYGVNLPRSSRDMMGAGTPISRAELRPGDLVFFNYGYSHVGIYTGDGMYIHSPSTGKRIQESSLDGRGRSEHYVAARRVIDNKGVTTISDKLKAEWVMASRHNTTLAMNDRAARRHTGADAYRGGSRSSRSSKAVASRNTRNSRKNLSQTASKSSKTHKVSSGDTLVDVAKRYGVTATDLAAYNNIANRNRIKPGQAIKIPPKKTAAKDSGKTASAKTATDKAKAKAQASAKAKSGSKKAVSAKNGSKASSKAKAKTPAKASSKGKAATAPKAKGASKKS